MVERHGDPWGTVLMRKFACRYLQGAPGSRTFRDAITRASGDLQKASHAMAEQLYKQSEANAANAAASAEKKDDDVREGEVVEA